MGGTVSTELGQLQDSSGHDEFQSWSQFHYRSVGVGSAELVMWLPGNLGYTDGD